MKIISTILIFIATIAQTDPAYITTRETLTNALEKVETGESIWLVGAMAESFESQIIGQMAQEIPWQMRLENWKPLSFEDYREIILSRGFTIDYTEVHREMVLEPDWVWILPHLGLEPAETYAFADEFRARCHRAQGGVYKQLLMQVTNSAKP